MVQAFFPYYTPDIREIVPWDAGRRRSWTAPSKPLLANRLRMLSRLGRPVAEVPSHRSDAGVRAQARG